MGKAILFKTGWAKEVLDALRADDRNLGRGGLLGMAFSCRGIIDNHLKKSQTVELFLEDFKGKNRLRVVFSVIHLQMCYEG
ncbi:hypothetical protein NPIL_565911 [Nephila pilipes]|uniref:Uncharacterized protein n=1 Tax=Nephila pilipes TaxID=299642 RepID=A0A8X6QZW0_NEPPI|nr:hypothetical protein NPIL_565911 [Nephila pilipes]